MASVPAIVRESATSKAAGKKWMKDNMNANYAFVVDGRLHDKTMPTVVFHDAMGAVKGVRRHIPGHNVLEVDPLMPVMTPVATAREVLLRPVLSSFRHYSARAHQTKSCFTMVLCFDYYGVENLAKQLCHEMRAEHSDEDEMEPPPIPLQQAYIEDWDKPLPENWAELMKSRDIAMPVILRDITKEILRLQAQEMPAGQKLIICGHSLDVLSVKRQNNGGTLPANLTDDDLRRWPLVVEQGRVFFNPELCVDQIEGDLQMFSLMKMVTRVDDIVHIISKDTDVMYYALWYASSQDMPRVKQFLWKHQWSQKGDSWVDVYQLCSTIVANAQFGKIRFQEAVKNLVVCLVATGTDYTSGFQGVGHVKWMKPMVTAKQSSIAPLFGKATTANGVPSAQQAVCLNQEAYYDLATFVLGPKKIEGNEAVIKALGGQLDYYVQRFLQSVGFPGQPQGVNLYDFPYHPEFFRLYEWPKGDKMEM